MIDGIISDINYEYRSSSENKFLKRIKYNYLQRRVSRNIKKILNSKEIYGKLIFSFLEYIYNIYNPNKDRYSYVYGNLYSMKQVDPDKYEGTFLYYLKEPTGIKESNATYHTLICTIIVDKEGRIEYYASIRQEVGTLRSRAHHEIIENDIYPEDTKDYLKHTFVKDIDTWTIDNCQSKAFDLFKYCLYDDINNCFNDMIERNRRVLE